MVDRKNFNAIVFNGTKYLKYRNINNYNKFISFLNNSHSTWKFVTIYDRKTNEREVIKRREIAISSFDLL